MSEQNKTLLRPLYKNKCACGNTSACSICMAKYQRKYYQNMTVGEREIKRAMQRIDYANMTPEVREIRLAAGRVRQQKYIAIRKKLREEK